MLPGLARKTTMSSCFVWQTSSGPKVLFVMCRWSLSKKAQCIATPVERDLDDRRVPPDGRSRRRSDSSPAGFAFMQCSFT